MIAIVAISIAGGVAWVVLLGRLKSLENPERAFRSWHPQPIRGARSGSVVTRRKGRA